MKHFLITGLISNALSLLAAMFFARVTPDFAAEGIRGILLAALIFQWIVIALLWAGQGNRIHTVSSYETLRTHSMIKSDTQSEAIQADQQNFSIASQLAFGSLPMGLIYAALLIWT